MEIFTKRELKLVEKLRAGPVDASLEIREPCPVHSVCTPLPLVSLHRESDETFAVQWNSHHRPGIRQVFRFAEIGQDHSGSTR